MMKSKQMLYLCVVILVSLAMGCTDDLGISADNMDEGEATLLVTASFNQEQTELSTRAVEADSGNIIENIHTLYMVVYKADGTLYQLYPVYGIAPHKDVTNVKYELADNRSKDEKGPKENQALQDSLTGKVTYELKLNRGSYYIYAVANVDNLPGMDISTRDKLKAIEFTWDKNETDKNNQMFGVYSIEPDRTASDGSPLEVSGSATRLHCWVRRLVSKVTVAFDGSDLYDNVQIYITDIAIKDIPKKCTLGNPNRSCPDNPNGDPVQNRLKRHDATNGVIETGKSIHIQTLSEDVSMIQPERYLHVCNDKHRYLGIDEDGGSISNAHAHNALSLFFYENMQGTGKSKKQSKNGITIDFPNPDIHKPESGWKDEKAYGTYVEVTGYYRCLTATHVSSGPITFRYMLGQKSPEDDDYNAIRNTHYKLTLKFKGYGNDADWHIDYEEHPGIYINSPQYISYLYNKQMVVSVKIVGKMTSTLHAEIVGVGKETDNWKTARKNGETFWRPWGDGSKEFPDPQNETDPIIPTYAYPWDNTAFKFVTGMAPDGNKRPYYWLGKYPYTLEGSVYEDGPWNSFLSLRQTNIVAVEDNSVTKPEQTNYNYRFFTGQIGGNHRGERTYEIDKGTYDSDTPDGSYRVEYTKKAPDGTPTERIFYIPLYTRAKTLITRSGYVGNNPYVGYPRKAKVKFWAKIDDPDKGSDDKKSIELDIIQVRRVVNPKGIWRKAKTSNPDFHVRLLRLPKDDLEEDFVSFNSDGGWCADIVSGGDNIISLSTTSDGSGDNKAQHGVTHIEGASEHPIDFKIRFNGEEGCAVVRVRYHNYTCEHDIFCSAGDKPIQLTTRTSPTDKKALWWHPRNVHHFKTDGTPVYTDTPVEEGSLFRRGVSTAILPENNKASKLGLPPGSFMVLQAGATNTSSADWEALKPNKDKNFSSWSIPNTNERIATAQDYFTLISTTNEPSFEIKQAYGVLYGDGVTEVKYTQKEAYETLGMRGCFVYNKNTCQHIFLPIGASGHGHRKHSGGWRSYDPAGALRYASRSYPFDYFDYATLQYQPLFYDLYRRNGAIYWCRDRKSGTQSGASSSAFDINYYTMGFNGYGNDATTNDNGSDSHACFIRTVYTENPNK